jgi:hypothetical protein
VSEMSCWMTYKGSWIHKPRAASSAWSAEHGRAVHSSIIVQPGTNPAVQLCPHAKHKNIIGRNNAQSPDPGRTVEGALMRKGSLICSRAQP